VPFLNSVRRPRWGAYSEPSERGEKGEPILNLESAYFEASERGEMGVPALNLEGGKKGEPILNLEDT
jgi:hypothetical protein